MRAITAVLGLLCGVLIAGCTVREEGLSSSAASSDHTARTRVSVPGEADPCSLLSQPQRDRLGVKEGRPVEDVQLQGAAFCAWHSRDFSGDNVQGAILPNTYLLANIRRNYELPKDLTVAGLPAVSGSIGGISGESSCYIFAELPDGRLADASFWSGSDEGMTHAIACEHAVGVLEMIVETMRSR